MDDELWVWVYEKDYMEFQSGGPYTKKGHDVHEKDWRINTHLLDRNKQLKVCTHYFCDSFFIKLFQLTNKQQTQLFSQ